MSEDHIAFPNVFNLLLHGVIFGPMQSQLDWIRVGVGDGGVQHRPIWCEGQWVGSASICRHRTMRSPKAVHVLVGVMSHRLSITPLSLPDRSIANSGRNIR